MNRSHTTFLPTHGTILLLIWLGFLVLTATAPLLAEELLRLASQSSNITAIEAEQLEGYLLENPEDLTTRAQLLGFYLLHSSEGSSTAKAEHVLWIVRNRPDSPLAGSPYCQLRPWSADFYRVKAAWLEAVESHSDQSQVLGNASRFFLLHDRDLVVALLKTAQTLEPDTYEWSQRLAELYSLGFQGQSGKVRRQAASAAFEQARPWSDKRPPVS